MYLLILTSDPGAGERVRAALGDAADRYTVAASWSDVASSIDKDRPDLILVDRAALGQMALDTLLKLTQPDRWPPLLLVDTSVAAIKDGVTVTQRLAHPLPHYYEIGDLRIDTWKKRAGLGERWVALPPIQYRLLLTLAQRAGEVIGCQQLLRAVWGYDGEEVEARELVKVHIRQLRRRLGLDLEKNHYIHSVRGFGYVLAPPEEG